MNVCRDKKVIKKISMVMIEWSFSLYNVCCGKDNNGFGIV